MKKPRFLLLICAVSLLVPACINIAGECKTTVSKRAANKAGTLQAVSETTDCGATTTPSSGLKIIEGDKYDDVGTRENTVLGSKSGFNFYWKSNDTLMVVGADTTGGFVMKTAYDLTKSKGRVVIVYLTEESIR